MVSGTRVTIAKDTPAIAVKYVPGIHFAALAYSVHFAALAYRVYILNSIATGCFACTFATISG